MQFDYLTNVRWYRINNFNHRQKEKFSAIVAHWNLAWLQIISKLWCIATRIISVTKHAITTLKVRSLLSKTIGINNVTQVTQMSLIFSSVKPIISLRIFKLIHYLPTLQVAQAILRPNGFALKIWNESVWSWSKGSEMETIVIYRCLNTKYLVSFGKKWK